MDEENGRRLFENIKANYEKVKATGNVSYIPTYGYPRSPFYVDAKLTAEVQWSKFDETMRPEDSDENQARLVILYNLGFDIANIPPYPVIEPNWEVLKVNNAEFSYTPCQKEGFEGIYLVRSRKSREKGRKMVLNEFLIWTPDEQALQQFLKGK